MAGGRNDLKEDEKNTLESQLIYLRVLEVLDGVFGLEFEQPLLLFNQKFI